MGEGRVWCKCAYFLYYTSKSDVWTGYGRELYMSKKENPEVKQCSQEKRSILGMC